MSNAATTYTVSFSTQYRTWFACRSEQWQGEFKTLAEADKEAAKRNAI